jgi:hypothetical protein
VSDDEPGGVGQCMARGHGLGHVWRAWYDSPRKCCAHCGAPGRDNLTLGESGGFYGQATMARNELFSTLAAPKSSFGSVKAKGS